jgi:hypothetical protein
MKCRKWIVITLLTVWLSTLLCMITASNYFAYNRPVRPNLSEGRNYALRYHYTTVYLTNSEDYLVEGIIRYVSTASLLLAAVLTMAWRPFERQH